MPLDLRVLEYEQKVSPIGGDDVYDVLEFSHVSPLLVRKNSTACVIHQTGRALTWGGRMIAPVPLGGDSAVHLAKPKIDYQPVFGRPNAWETTWEYVRAVDQAYVDALDIVAVTAWPSAPVFA